MTLKTYKVAGVSRKDGVWAVRYANSMSRVGVLTRAGHDRVHLFVMPYDGAKEDCVDFLLNQKWNIGLKDAWAAIQEEAKNLGFLV